MDDFRSLVERELKNQATEDEKNFLRANKSTLKQWEQVLLLAETETMTQITNQKQVQKIQRESIVLHTNPGEERSEALRLWGIEKGLYHRERIRKLTKRLNVIKQKRMGIQLQLKSPTEAEQTNDVEQAEAKARIHKLDEELRLAKLQRQQQKIDAHQDAHASAISYRKGYKHAIGRMLSLIRDGIDPDAAYELCKEYANVELKMYTEHPENGKPPFPGVIYQEEEEEED